MLVLYSIIAWIVVVLVLGLTLAYAFWPDVADFVFDLVTKLFYLVLMFVVYFWWVWLIIAIILITRYH